MNKFFNKNNTKYAKKRRTSQTPGEIVLWTRLRNRQLLGYKFRRQYQASKYIIDFVCLELMLAIEIDGSSHDENRYDKDVEREIFLGNLGFKFLRFTEFEVRTRVNSVLQTIVNFVEDNN